MPTESKTTTTQGYFNANPFGIAINSSAMGLNIVLATGAYVINRAGQKVNDPKLESYLGPNSLSKAVGDPVPLVLINPENAPGTHSVSALPYKPQPQPKKAVASPNRQVQRAPTTVTITDRPIPPKPHAPSTVGSPGFSGRAGPGARPEIGYTPPGVNPAVKVFTVKEAEERGIIRRAAMPVAGLEAKDGSSAKEAPYIDEVVRQRHVAPAPHRVPITARITTPVGPEPVLEEESPPEEAAPAVETVVLVDPKKPYVAPDGKAFKYFQTFQKYIIKNYSAQQDAILSPYRAAAGANPGE